MHGRTETLRLEKDRYLLGRLSTNDLSFPEDGGLSRQHMVLEREGDGWTVNDLGSMNGTFVNGVRLAEKRRLQPGDSIRAGQLVLTFGNTVTPSGNTVVFNPSTSVDPGQQKAVRTNLELALQQQDSEDGTAMRQPLSPVAALLRAGREFAAKRPLSELFWAILDLSIEAVAADRGVLLTIEGDELVVQASRGENFRISSTVRDTVLREKTSLLVRDTSLDQAFREQKSIVMQQVRTLMAVPLQTDERVIGLLYLDSPFGVRLWTADDLNLLTVMANVAAIRLERERLQHAEESRRLLAAELNQAADIQRRFLPGDAPVVEGLDLGGYNIPSRSVGGDYYDFFNCPDGRQGCILGDVAGKGMPAALMMMNLQARAQVLAEAISDPAEFLTSLNRAIKRNCPDNRFITVFYCAIDPRDGTLSYANAGHNPPIIARADGTVEWIRGGDPVLGILPGIKYTGFESRLETGDALILYSDGVTEATDPRGEEFGEERLAQLVVANRTAPADTLIKMIEARITDWSAGTPAPDDITVLVAKKT
jgi:serine phosphatase RsbU (regulator of sigma subunit)/pSer/pThr/pTyr-binding forkhead associated (FHA) protein